MEDFIAFAVKEGGDASVARNLWRAGMTQSAVEKAKAVGLSYKDLEEMWGQFGQNSIPVLIEVIGRIKR